MAKPILLAALALTTACGDNKPDDGISECTVGGEPLSILVMTRENMWTHPSNPVAAEALKQLAVHEHWRVFVTGDQADITLDRMKHTDVLVFSVTSGPILDADQRAMLEPFIAGGLGFVGIHSASATESDWPLYREMIPITFLTHPFPNNVLNGSIRIVATDDPLLADIPDPWPTVDEFYTFNERPESIEGLHLLYALDENSYDPVPSTVKVGFHPLAFTTERTGNRAYYTALGHDPAEYDRPEFMGSLRRAIEWTAANRHAARCAGN